jgi:subtilisin family serine protease
VGSANDHGTALRGDDAINHFSSRGPTFGVWVDSVGKVRHDDMVKPDLVAPGNRVLGALSQAGKTYNTIVSLNPWLRLDSYAATSTNGLMELSGTSIAAPVVSGAVALMLQANPGLTPPLIKAILQYTAQPLPGASLVQQGAGLLNVEGAVRLAGTLRTDIAGAITAGTIRPGNSLLRSGMTLPAPVSYVGGETINWSRIVIGGGSHLLSGPALFQSYQGFYDPRVVWSRNWARLYTPVYWPSTRPAST